ncbi:glutamate--tRNA ligase family protein [Candidatus Vidania fulgoroideorum]
MAYTVTRFAPSPSGNLHIGNLRVAMITWIFAYINNGLFIVRCDNTNQLRSSLGFQWAHLKVLRVFNISYNSSFQQQLRRRIYYCFAWLLFLERNAYFLNGALWVFCGSDVNYFLDYLRFKLITVNNCESFVIVRSSGVPVYNFCSVVDDHLMAISYVIRGCDHITNTFKQLALAKQIRCYLGKFFHLPLIVGMSGFKLSKRFTTLNILHLLAYGFLRKPLVCYLLGLHITTLRLSVFTYLLTYFSLNNLVVSNFRYDIGKLICYNKFAIATISFTKIYSYLSSLYFSPIYITVAMLTLIAARSAFITDIDYYYHNYYLVLFTHTYVLFDKRIFYILSNYFIYNHTAFLSGLVVEKVGTCLTTIYFMLNMFCFNSNVNVPAVGVYLASLGWLNISLILQFILFI